MNYTPYDFTTPGEYKEVILASSSLTDIQKLRYIFDYDSDRLQKENPQLYYAILAVLDAAKPTINNAEFMQHVMAENGLEIKSKASGTAMYYSEHPNTPIPWTVNKPVEYLHAFAAGFVRHKLMSEGCRKPIRYGDFQKRHQAYVEQRRRELSPASINKEP